MPILYLWRHLFSCRQDLIKPNAALFCRHADLTKQFCFTFSMQTNTLLYVDIFLSFVLKAPKSQYSVQKWKIKHNILFIYHYPTTSIFFRFNIDKEMEVPKHQISSRIFSQKQVIQKPASDSTLIKKWKFSNPKISRRRSLQNVKVTFSLADIQSAASHSKRCIKSLSTPITATLYVDY